MAECNHDEECQYTPRTLTPTPLPVACECEGGGGGGEGHKYTFVKTATGWQVKEDGRVIFTYNDQNDNTTYTWQATTDGWLVKDNNGNVLFTYKDKDTDTTYAFEKKDDCGFKVTNSKGEVVFDYDNDCAGTTYSFEQDGVDIKVTDNKTGKLVFTYKGTKDTTYTYENYKKGFKVTDSNGTVVYIYDPEFDRSDGSYPIDTLLTTVFKGHTTISTGQIIGFDPAKLVVGETLVYDGVGTVGVITKDNGDGTYQVTTMTISPGSRQGVRLGSVDKEEDLPTTCAAAEALGWQTPQLGDFAYVIEGDGTSEDVISEYVITNIDDDCNITWTFSHSFNAGEYQEQSTTGMSGMILTGGPVAGTFGTPIDPSTLIRGVMRNGVLLTPDAQGKVNVIVDDSHVIVNALPTTGIVDHVEYLVIDPTTLKVKSTWVHDATGWYQTYEAQVVVKSHQIVTALPTTGIEENVEYIIVDADGKHSETWVYDPTLGWVQTEVKDSPAHIVVKTLPTTGIDDKAEYVQVSDLNDPVNTYVASWVHTDKGWIKTAENSTADKAHIAVTALPTTNINENAEYVVMDDLTKPDTYKGTWVRVKGNWVQTDRLENGFHIVTSLPTSNIDDKHDYIVVEDLTKPDETLIGHYAYDSATKKWISLSSKYEVYHGVSLNGYSTNADDFQDMPVGGVAPFFGTTAPAHYLLCDGTVYNVGDYPELEAFIIENYGKLNQFGGNGTSTWAVPDLRGEFLRGAGANSHTSALPSGAKEGDGAGVGEHQGATTISVVNGSSNYTSEFIETTAGDYRTANADRNNGNTGGSQLTWGVTRAHPGTLTIGGMSPLTTRPTNTSVNWIIKCESTYAILPAEGKYRCAATVTYNMTANVMSFPIFSNVQDNTAMITNVAGQNQAFVAPIDGYYAYTFEFGETADIANMTYHAFYVYKNGAVVGGGDRHDDYETASGTSADLRFPLESSGVMKLKKGDKVATAVFYNTKTSTGSMTRTGLSTFVLIQATGSEAAKAETMLKPNTWAVGIEQDFGDGVYGIRYAGNATNGAASGGVNPRNTIVLNPNFKPSTHHIINTGGMWDRSGMSSPSTHDCYPLGAVYMASGASTAAVMDNWLSYTENVGLQWCWINNAAATTKYDVWVLYTK